MDGGSPIPNRIIILGASNVALGFPLIVNTVRRSLPQPVQLFAAHGHGRSFCDWSYVLHRGLPSILDCDLWTDLATQSSAELTWGLVTDIGNDLLYGRSLEQVEQRISAAMQRLSDTGASITFVRPPLESILRLSPWRYWLTKQIMFPGPTVPWPRMSEMIQELDARITQTATRLEARIITPQPEWYGIDPIHIRTSHRSRAWETILSTWPFPSPPQVVHPTINFAKEVWTSPPKQRTLWKRHHHHAQPAWKAETGASLWLY